MINLSGIPRGKDALEASKFHFWGHIASIDPQLIPYNYIRRQFHVPAQTALKHFESLYRKNCRSLDDVIQKSTDLFIESLLPIWKECVQALVDCGIVYIDINEFITQYQNYYDCWTTVFDLLSDQYAQIVCSQQELDEYRTRRRENRGRFVGGGFGLANAAKGIAIAGVANMAFGAAHMVFNGLGKIGSSVATSRQKSKIFDDPNTLTKLLSAVYDTAFSCHYALIACLNSELHAGLSLGISSEQSEKSDNALENLQSNYFSEKAKWDTLIFSFTNNPYNWNWYSYMLTHFFDPNGELDTAADYFGITLSHEKAKHIEAEVHNMDTSTVEAARNTLVELRPFMEKYHYWGSFPTKAKAKKKIEQHEQKMRTVSFGIEGEDPILCRTIEQAELMRKQVSYVQEILKQYDPNQENSCREALKTIEHLKVINQKRIFPEVKSTYCHMLRQKCNAFDQKAKTAFGQLYDSRESAAYAIREYSDLKQLLTNSPDTTQLDDIKSRIQLANLPAQIIEELNGLLYEAEHRTELRAIRSLNFVAIIALIAIIAIGTYLPIAATEELHHISVFHNGNELLMHEHHIVTAVSFMDGLKNSIAIWGKSVVTFFLSIIADYIDGFHGTIDGHIMWLLLGWLKALWDNLWLSLERYFVTLWYTFRQSSDLSYCAGYILSTLFSWYSLLRLSTSEKERIAKLHSSKS